MSQPLISLVVPVYNVEKYLDSCLSSIMEQTYTNIEVLLVNDGSTDGSRDICQSFCQKDVRFLLFDKPNGGLSDARNYGIQKATGSYITFIDSDDQVDSDYVSYLYELLNRNNVKMAICQHRTVFSSGKVEEHPYNGAEVLTAEEAIERMLYHDQIDTSAWAKMYTRDVLEPDFFPVGKLFEDIGSTYRAMIKVERLAIGSEPKYTYAYRAQSIVNGSFNLKKLDLIEMTKRMKADVDRQYPALAPATTSRLAYAYVSTLNQMIDVKDYRDVRRNLVRHAVSMRGVVLSNSKVQTRDKVAVILLSLGFPIYRIAWKLYLKVKKGA